jgi:hypothetical protein
MKSTGVVQRDLLGLDDRVLRHHRVRPTVEHDVLHQRVRAGVVRSLVDRRGAVLVAERGVHDAHPLVPREARDAPVVVRAHGLEQDPTRPRPGLGEVLREEADVGADVEEGALLRQVGRDPLHVPAHDRVVPALPLLEAARPPPEASEHDAQSMDEDTEHDRWGGLGQSRGVYRLRRCSHHTRGPRAARGRPALTRASATRHSTVHSTGAKRVTRPSEFQSWT